MPILNRRVYVYVGIGALIALLPLASFALIALEVIMIYQIAKSHDEVHLWEIVWYCSITEAVSFFLKFLALWLHFIPVIGQIANSIVAGGFIFFVYNLTDDHYKKKKLSNK
jgi:hypothetical protein